MVRESEALSRNAESEKSKLRKKAQFPDTERAVV
jgi:hypothetical protein